MVRCTAIAEREPIGRGERRPAAFPQLFVIFSPWREEIKVDCFDFGCRNARQQRYACVGKSFPRTSRQPSYRVVLWARDPRVPRVDVVSGLHIPRPSFLSAAEFLAFSRSLSAKAAALVYFQHRLVSCLIFGVS